MLCAHRCLGNHILFTAFYIILRGFQQQNLGLIQSPSKGKLVEIARFSCLLIISVVRATAVAVATPKLGDRLASVALCITAGSKCLLNFDPLNYQSRIRAFIDLTLRVFKDFARLNGMPSTALPNLLFQKL